MLRPYGSVVEHLWTLERPIPPLLASRVFAPPVHRAQYHLGTRRNARNLHLRNSVGQSSSGYGHLSTSGKDAQVAHCPADSRGALAARNVNSRRSLHHCAPLDSSHPTGTVPIRRVLKSGRTEFRSVRRGADAEAAPVEDEGKLPLFMPEIEEEEQPHPSTPSEHEDKSKRTAAVVSGATHDTSPPDSFKWSMFANQWRAGMANLQHRQQDLDTTLVQPKSASTLEGVARHWVRRFEKESSNLEAAEKYWHNMALEERSGRWPRMMLHYLDASPLDALFLMRSVLPFYKPPPEQMADALGVIARYLVPKSHLDVPLPRNAANMLDALDLVLEHYDQPLPISESTMYLVTRCLPIPQIVPSLERLRDRGYAMSTAVVLMLARSLSARLMPDRALDLMDFALTVGADPASRDVGVTVTSIMRYTNDILNPNSVTMRLISRVVSMGLPPNIQTFNFLLLDAIEGGKPEVAWQIYDMLQTGDVEINHVTYGIMLQLSRTMHDRLRYRSVYLHLDPEKKDVLDPWLVAEILQCRQVFNERDNFDHLLIFYERHCNLQPLKDLGILAPDYQSRVADYYSSPRPQPSTVALTITLLKYLQSSYKTESVLRLYTNFRKEVAHGNPAIVPLAANDYVWNGFFKAMDEETIFLGDGRLPGFEQNPLYWVNMLQDMTSDPLINVINPETRRPLEKVVPSKQTWNILLHAHARRGNVSTADRILATMQQNGMTPDIVTWNSLLRGFSPLQDLGIVSTVLRTMKDHGMGVDQHTAKALSYLGDPQQLQRALHEGQTKAEEKKVHASDEGHGPSLRLSEAPVWFTEPGDDAGPASKFFTTSWQLKKLKLEYSMHRKQMALGGKHHAAAPLPLIDQDGLSALRWLALKRLNARERSLETTVKKAAKPKSISEGVVRRVEQQGSTSNPAGQREKRRRLGKAVARRVDSQRPAGTPTGQREKGRRLGKAVARRIESQRPAGKYRWDLGKEMRRIAYSVRLQRREIEKQQL